MANKPSVAVLAPDPVHRRCILNGNAFQQDAVTSFRGWQYAAVYSSLPGGLPEPLYIHLGRRELPDGKWELLVFRDYPQTAVSYSTGANALGGCFHARD
jgi:hypothetical protein